MPLTSKGEQIMRSMKEEYGPEKGERVFYASKNAGKISGVDDQPLQVAPGPPLETQTQAESGTSMLPNVGSHDAAEGSLPAGEPKEAPTVPSGLPETVSVGQTVAAAMSRWNSGRG